MLVRIGMGRKRIAKSVIILTGAEERYSVTISVHWAVGGTGDSNAAAMGRHCTMFKRVRASPAMLTTAIVETVAQ